jgi:cytosine deaminase
VTADPAIVITGAALRRRSAERLGMGDTHGPGARYTIVIRDGRYESVAREEDGGGAGPDRAHASAGRSEAGPGIRTIDAGGALVTESFVNGHLHLCKVNTLSMVGDAALAQYHGEGMGGAMTAIELASAVKQNYRTELLLPGIRTALDQAVRYGMTHIRAFADTDTTARQEGIRAVMQARDEYRDRVEVQAVAFPQDGVIRDPGAADEVAAALDAGADVVGGIPWIEFTEADMQRHVDLMMDLAVKHDRDVSMLVDDAGDPGLHTLEMLAEATIARGWQGRVTAQHARALALYPGPHVVRIAGLLRQARMGLVSDPHTGPLHAPIRTLRAHGVDVALGQDDIADAYYPFGRNNMLEVGFLAAHLLSMTSEDEQETILDMLTVDGAHVLGMHEFSIAPGNEANLIVHRQSTVRDLLAVHEEPAVVIRGGRVICERSDT